MKKRSNKNLFSSKLDSNTPRRTRGPKYHSGRGNAFAKEQIKNPMRSRTKELGKASGRLSQSKTPPLEQSASPYGGNAQNHTRPSITQRQSSQPKVGSFNSESPFVEGTEWSNMMDSVFETVKAKEDGLRMELKEVAYLLSSINKKSESQMLESIVALALSSTSYCKKNLHRCQIPKRYIEIFRDVIPTAWGFIPDV